jgi:hypothetical protein
MEVSKTDLRKVKTAMGLAIIFVPMVMKVSSTTATRQNEF